MPPHARCHNTDLFVVKGSGESLLLLRQFVDGFLRLSGVCFHLLLERRHFIFSVQLQRSNLACVLGFKRLLLL